MEMSIGSFTGPLQISEIYIPISTPRNKQIFAFNSMREATARSKPLQGQSHGKVKAIAWSIPRACFDPCGRCAINVVRIFSGSEICSCSPRPAQNTTQITLPWRNKVHFIEHSANSKQLLFCFPLKDIPSLLIETFPLAAHSVCWDPLFLHLQIHC